MARVPFIGRLFWREYIALFGSFVLIFLESFIRIVTLGLPGPVIRWFYNRSKNAFNFLSSPQGRLSRARNGSISASIAQAHDFVDICAFYGYYAEEHVVQTGDGYLLGLHRLGWKRGEEGMVVNGGNGSIRKKVVYLHHGLMMNSEVWVCLTEKERCLPFMLVDQGYDVWLGNNRGNKYSKKSTRHSPLSTDFWNFSIDEFAFHDIPDSIDYILDTTSSTSLSYIGFSQGTAQAFASLSIHPPLNEKVDVFIALAPAMSPAGIAHGVVNALIKSSPNVIYLAFGRRSILSSATMWQSLLYPPIFVRIIDFSLSGLFGWKSQNISVHQKLAAYPHLYSFTSTKSVVHWFQIIRNNCFQLYDDDVQPPTLFSTSDRYYKVAKFPTRNIKTPIVLLYGGSDSLIDINVMLKELPRHTTAKEIPHFEHLDFLWAQNVDKLVFPHVFSALEEFAGRDHAKDQRFMRVAHRNRLLLGAQADSTEPSEDDALSNQDSETLRGNGNGDSYRSSSSQLPIKVSGSSGLSSSSTTVRARSPLPDFKDPPLFPGFPNLPQRREDRSDSLSSSVSADRGIRKVSDVGIAIGAGKATLGGVSTVKGDGSNAEEKKGRGRTGKKRRVGF
ncbi:cholesterol esterase [Agyrium rufum]|nr:cholesterol esterase [Agyrium rufum]